MDKCEITTCGKDVSKEGHRLCYEHWKLEKDGDICACEKCGKYKDNTYPLCTSCFAARKGGQEGKKSYLNSTKIGDGFKLSGKRINQILAELGWVTKGLKGWVMTPQGESRGAIAREIKESGVPYVVWPADIISDKDLIRSIKIYRNEYDGPGETIEDSSAELSFREKFPATHRTMDGHMVRSRGELLIDNFLYVQGKVHAYERLVPIKEDLYCDFYLPEGKVYIEYWGIEDNEKYKSRKQAKIKLYKKYKLNLLELSNEQIDNLDDHLPKMLLKFDIITE